MLPPFFHFWLTFTNVIAEEKLWISYSLVHLKVFELAQSLPDSFSPKLSWLIEMSPKILISLWRRLNVDPTVFLIDLLLLTY